MNNLNILMDLKAKVEAVQVQTTAIKLNKSELFKLAHQIAKFRCKVYYGSYQKAFGVVLKELYAQGGAVWGWNV